MIRAFERSRLRLFALTIGILAVALALTALRTADARFTRATHWIGSTPITVYEQAGGSEDRVPVVLIAHGFAGSQQLMQSFAATLARNGYLAVTFDYLGHGRNGEPLRGDVTQIEGATEALLEQTRAVADFALSLPRASGELAVLGHSMASDIVVRYAQRDERVRATVAVSMFSPAVTASEPKNLLIVVGGLETALKAEALRAQALVTETPAPGVTAYSAAAGARRAVFASGVEHVGVLYSRVSLQESVDWLNEVFATSSPGGIDQRGPWVALLLMGVLLLAWPLSQLLPQVSKPPLGAALSWRQLLPAALFPAIGTPLILAGFPADFLGVLVGGYLAVHFAVYGALTFAALWWMRRKAPAATGITDWRALILASSLTTLYAAGVVALVLDRYVTSFAINGLRAPLLLLMLGGTVCYFLSDEWLAHGASTARAGHFFTRCCFLLSLGIAVALSFDELLFLAIIAGVIVLYFFVYGFISRWVYGATGHPFVGGIANAVAFAVALTAVFPLMSG